MAQYRFNGVLIDTPEHLQGDELRSFLQGEVDRINSEAANTPSAPQVQNSENTGSPAALNNTQQVSQSNLEESSEPSTQVEAPEVTPEATPLQKLRAQQQQLQQERQQEQQPQQGQQQKQRKSPNQKVVYGPPITKANPRELASDGRWLHAANTYYRMHERKNFDGTPQELNTYILQQMANFNHNIPHLLSDGYSLKYASDQEKAAMLFLLETYDDSEITWQTAWDTTQAVALDPTNLLSVGTLGLGFAGRQAAKTAARTGFVAMLKESLKRTGYVAMVDSGIIGAVHSDQKQRAEVTIGRREEVSTQQTLIDAGVSALGGAVLGTGLDAAATALAPKASAFVRSFKTSKAGGNTPIDNTVKPRKPTKAEIKAAGEAGVNAAKALRNEVVPTSRPVEEVFETPSSRPGESTSSPSDQMQNLLEGNKGASPSRDLVDPNAPRVVEGEFSPATPTDSLLPTPKSMDIPYKRITIAEAKAFSKGLVDSLGEMHFTEVDDFIRLIQDTKMSKHEAREFGFSLATTVGNLKEHLGKLIEAETKVKNPQKLAKIAREKAEVEALVGPMSMLDDAWKGYDGSAMRLRQEAFGLNIELPETLMAKHNVSREEAERMYAESVNRAYQSKQARDTAKQYDKAIEKAVAEGDLEKASDLVVKKSEKLARITGVDNFKEASWGQKAVELAIANVFSIKTVMVNMVPSAAKVFFDPAITLMTKSPFSSVARREAYASYAAMSSGAGAAWKAAIAAFKYEQALLLGQNMRFHEGGVAIKGLKGSTVRTIPKLLNSSDEFLGQMAYRGYLAGEATGRAYELGVSKGLKGKALNKYIADEVKRAIDNGFDVDVVGQMNVIYNKGVSYGLRGEKLSKYVEKELQKTWSKSTSKGNNEMALAYVKDTLFKREFSGDTVTSKAAKLSDEVLSDNPTLKIMLGQLFFRTPIRVMEMAMKYTPGLQLASKSFRDDISGRNGARRQVQAKGQFLVSQAIVGWALIAYSKGQLTGGGGHEDWRNQRASTDGSKVEPYSIVMDDGSTISYRYLEPFAVPFKVLVNSMERFEKLKMRKAQGEYIEQSEIQKTLAGISVVTGSVVMAVRDASLVTGIDEMMKFMESMKDPEGRETQMLKQIANRFSMLVPSTFKKMASTVDPTLNDPVTIGQVIEHAMFGNALQVLGLSDRPIPKSYNALGQERRLANTGTLWNLFARITADDRTRGLTKTQVDVLDALDDISHVTGSTFVAPYKHKYTGDIDLRTTLSSDGKTTLYDKWNHYYSMLEPEKGLSIILNSELPVGTSSQIGDKVKKVRSFINDRRDAAFEMLLQEEPWITERREAGIIRGAEVQSGVWDVESPF